MKDLVLVLLGAFGTLVLGVLTNIVTPSVQQRIARWASAGKGALNDWARRNEAESNDRIQTYEKSPTLQLLLRLDRLQHRLDDAVLILILISLGMLISSLPDKADFKFSAILAMGLIGFPMAAWFVRSFWRDMFVAPELDRALRRFAVREERRARAKRQADAQ